MDDEIRNEFDIFVEKIRIELGSLLNLMEKAKTVPYNGHKSRRQTKQIESLLKHYRKLSIALDKYNKEKKKKCKE